MTTRAGTILVAAAAAALPVLGLAPAARAQTTPAPAPAGFSARAHADVTVVVQDRTMSGSAQLGMAERPNLTRIDVLSVKTDAVPLPPIAMTAVIDRRANTITVWNDSTKRYHVQTFLPQPRLTASPRATPTPVASPAPAEMSALSKLDLLSMTLTMTGHTTTNGVPTTGLAFDLQVAKKGETLPTHVVVTMQIVDESAAFPMTLDASVDPGAAPFHGKLSYAVDELIRGAPPLSHFRVPTGYTNTTSLRGVVQPAR